MNNEFIPFEQALELKELGFEATPIGGFKQDAVFYYEKGELYYDYRPIYSSTSYEGQILAPLYQQVFRWFREKHNLYSFVFVFDQGFGYETYKEGVIQTNESFESYDEAQIACLDKLIELVKSK
jgi:hypothetical protein